MIIIYIVLKIVYYKIMNVMIVVNVIYGYILMILINQFIH